MGIEGGLPEWEDLRFKKTLGQSLTSLEEFIYKNEPTSVEDCAEWRRLLILALDDYADAVLEDSLSWDQR